MSSRSRPRSQLGRSGNRARPAPRNVILVDDDVMVRTALSRLLRGAGYKVKSFERPSEVSLGPSPPGNPCLVLDIYMPEMTGVGLWHALKEKIGLGLPAVLITGMRGEDSHLYGEQIGVAVLYKPIEEKELFEAIDYALGLTTSF